MNLSALDALQRGLLNLRANPMLVVLQMAQGLLVGLIAIAGLAPVVLALGTGAARTVWSASQGWNPAQSAEMERLLEQALEQWPLLLAALAAAFAVWTVAFLVYCWMQAGVMSQLAAGEERAVATERPAVADFEIYSWSGFTQAASARVWKFFWLINLLALVGLVVLFFAVLFLSLALTLTGNPPNFAVALTVGCLLMLVSLVVFFFLFAWTGVAKADMVVGDRGPVDAFRSSFGMLWRRLGAVLVLLLLFIAASIAIGVIFVPLSLGLDLAVGDSMGRQIAADVALTLLQTPFNAALTVALSAALVALVRGER